MFDVRLTIQAERAYVRLDENLQRRINRVFEQLEQGNFRHNNIRALRGRYAGSLRYRLGDWRIVFRVNHTEHVVWIEAITTRGGAYR